MRVRIGTAGWSLSGVLSDQFSGEGSHLARYARVLDGVEIDSSFHRPHRRSTYERWAGATPTGFRFAVKLPRSITHEGRLRAADAALDEFLGQCTGLGDKLGVLLVQLPPSLAFEAGVAGVFLAALRHRFAGAVACEPRHASWFSPAAEALLASARVARVGADPASSPAAARPGGWLGPAGDGIGALVYYRWHGSPKRYWSGYGEARLKDRAVELAHWPTGSDRWCVFDNTAGGAAIPDALALRRLLSRRRSVSIRGA